MTSDDAKQIDVLIKQDLKGVVTKKDLASVEARLKIATKKDLAMVEARLHREMATKKDLEAIGQKVKDDIDDAVAQISSAIDKTITPLARRVDRIEGHLELPSI